MTATAERDGSEEMHIQLRHELRPGDLGDVVRMHGIVYASEAGWDHTFEGYVAEGIGRFAVSYNAARERMWIAERGRDFAGCIAIVERLPIVAQLRWFLVHPSARGLGIGQTLIDEAISFARGCGYESVMLETVTGLDAAARLYRNAGFVVVREARVAQWGRVVTEEVHVLSLR